MDLFTLADDLVVLEPLQPAHGPELATAAADGDVGRLWYTQTPYPEEAPGYVASAIAERDAGRMLPFAVRDHRTGQVVGCTRYYDLQPAVPRRAIGYTWYAGSAQRTHINAACKRLLLAHAFEAGGCATVEFHTDFYNQRSRDALARLGARQDGILRAHDVRADGSLRDTVCFSILAREWPDVRRTLDLRILRSLEAPPAG